MHCLLSTRDGHGDAEDMNSFASLKDLETEPSKQVFWENPQRLDEKPIKGGCYGPILRDCVEARSSLWMEARDGKSEGIS